MHGLVVYLYRAAVESARPAATLPVVYRRAMTDKIRLTQYAAKSG